MAPRQIRCAWLSISVLALLALLGAIYSPLSLLQAQSATPAATSPVVDTGKIVYCDHTFGAATTAVTVLNSDGGHRLQLAVPLSKGQLQSAVLSPDGRSLAILAQSAAVPAINLYVLTLADRRLRQLSQNTPDKDASIHSEVGSVAWSPDSRQLLFVAVRYSSDGAYQVTKSSSASIVQADGSGQPQQVTTDGAVSFTASTLLHAASWSPDGQRLFIVGDASANGSTEHPQVLLGMDVDGKQVSTFYGAESNSLAWSPDGKRLAMATVAGALLIADTSGQIVQDVPRPAGISALQVAWSPGGTQLAIAGRDSDFNSKLYVMNTDGSNTRAVADLGDVSFSALSWRTIPPDVLAALPASH